MTSPELRQPHALTAACLLVSILLLAGLPAAAAEPAKCAPGALVLWGDGEHDDTAALNAWLRGERAVWAQSGEAVGPVVAGRSFVLSQAVYAVGGTGRTLERFRLLWPERNEIVTGDALSTGANANMPPAGTNIHIIGGDSGEGVAVEAPDPAPSDQGDPAKCLIS